MYLADDENGNVRGINTVIDFTKIIEFDDDGYYYEYSKADLDEENSYDFK